MGPIRAEIRRYRQAREAEWRDWAEATADSLITLPPRHRARALRRHQWDMTEQAWYRVVQSLTEKQPVQSLQAEADDPPADDGNPDGPASGAGPNGHATPTATPVMNGAPPAQAPAASPPPLADPPPTPSESPEIAPPEETFEARPRGRRRRGFANHLYDTLVGLITLGIVIAAMWWLLSGQIN